MNNPVICAVAVVSTTGAVFAQPLVSNFDASIEGWAVETRTDPAGAFSFVAAFTPDFVASGGDPGGHIAETDPDTNWSFFRAPGSWSGDRSAFLGRRLGFSIRTDTLNYPDGRLVILIGNNGQAISHDSGLPPLNTWTRREIPLEEGPWRLGTDASGAVATSVQIGAVLADLEIILIGMEFGGDVLEERVGLDRVTFGRCAADLDGDGDVDTTDLNILLSGFGCTGAPGACPGDADHDGDTDTTDLNILLSVFGLPCP